MRKDQPRFKIRGAALVFVASIITASCSDRSAPDRKEDVNTTEARVSGSEKAEHESELQPDKDQIAEDCVTFVRSTKVVPAGAASTDCPGCPARGTAVMAFRGMKKDSVSCSDETCTVVVTIRAVFNPGSGGTINGGLTAWISPEQRSAYLQGRTPSDEQAYRVQITYKRSNAGWRAVEFDRAAAE